MANVISPVLGVFDSSGALVSLTADSGSPKLTPVSGVVSGASDTVPAQKITQSGLALALEISRAGGIDCVQVDGSTTGTALFQRAFSDKSVFNSVGTGAYCSYDSNPELKSADAQNHFFSYESRLIYTGPGLVNTMSSFISMPTVTGSVNALRAYNIQTPGGSGGSIAEYAGYYCPDITYGATLTSAFYSGVNSGTGKYAINAAGTAQSYFGGPVTFAGNVTLTSATATINVTTAGAKIRSDTNTNISLGGTGTLARLSALNDASSAYIPFFISGSVVTINPNGTEALRVQSSGRVCVGTATDDGSNLLQVNGGVSAKTIKLVPSAVSALPSAATAGIGTRAFVSDATATTFASIVSGGGSNPVPVYSDGVSWRIG